MRRRGDFKEGSRWLGLSSKDSSSLLSPRLPLALFSFPFPMAAKADKASAIYLERRTAASCDSLTPPTLTPEEEAKVWRKIDVRLIPILALLYLFCFLDRGISYHFSASF